MERRAVFGCIVAALLGICLPALLVPVPPLLDYPNHLARLWLLAGGGAGGPLAQIYGVDWTGAVINIGTDLVARTVGPFVGPSRLPPLLLMVACVLPPLGAVLLNRAVYGGFHWWQAGFGLLAWCFTLLAGFLNFQISLGFALLAAASDPLPSKRRGAPVRRIATGAALLICHPFGCVFYGALLTSLAWGPGFRDPLDGSTGSRLGRVLWPGVCATLIPVAALWLFAPVLPGGHEATPMLSRWGGDFVLNKVLTALSVIVTYDARTDFLFVIALWIVLRWVIGMGRGRVHAGLWYGAGGMALASFAVPAAVADTAYIDVRLPVMAALMAAAGLSPTTRLPSWMAAAALAGVVLARTGWIGAVWEARQADVQSVARALASVPPGALVLPAEHCCQPGPIGRRLLVTTPTYLHDPALAVPWRQAFVPTLFAAPGKQPLRVLPPWDRLAAPEGRTAPLTSIRDYSSRPLERVFFGYLEHWRERFDYMLVINADTPDDTLDESVFPELGLVTDEGFARLYRINR